MSERTDMIRSVLTTAIKQSATAPALWVSNPKAVNPDSESDPT